HARCASVLARARESGESVEPADLASADLGRLTSDHEWALAQKLAELGDLVVRATEANEPHHVARYLLDLAAATSRWYTAGNGDPALRILSEDRDDRRARLALLAAAQASLRYGLSLLGLGAPDKM